MKLLLFEIIPNQIWRYTTNNYIIENEFYIFTDIKDGKNYKYHKSLFRGESGVEK